MVKTRVILNGVDLDVSDEIGYALTYSLVDITQPESRTSHYSKTISLPGTPTNNRAFGSLYASTTSVNSSGTTNYSLGYDPNLKASCIVMYANETLMSGYLQLNKIRKTDDTLIYYDCTVYSEFANMFSNIGDGLLQDLPLNDFNHPYTRDVQQASWDNYIYFNSGTIGFNYGRGYVYPMIDYGTNNDTDYKVTDNKPAFYLKEIVHRIINQAGYSVSPTSWTYTDSHFSRMIVPYTQGNLTLSSSQISNRTFAASSNAVEYVFTSGTVANTSRILFQDETTPPNFDTGGVWDNSTSLFTCSKAGTYKFTSNLSASVTHFPVSATVLPFNSYIIGYIFAWHTNAQNGAQTLFMGGGVVVCKSSSNFVPNYFNINNGGSSCVSGTTSPISSGVLTGSIYLNVGDTVRLDYRNTTPSQNNIYNESVTSASNIRLNLLSGCSFKAEIADTSIMEGDTVDCNNILPKNIKQRDFLLSVFKTFNLYVDTDRQNTNQVEIYPRDDFYASSGTTQDWTKKLDLAKEVQLVPMGFLNARVYRYKFKDDSDYYNKLYQDKWRETYGSTRRSIVNDFLSNTDVTEVMFSPTPLADRNGTDRIIPRIISVDSNGNISPQTGNMRLLYYGGVKSTAFAWNYQASSGTNVMTTYPYAGHLDNTTYPTYDVNFSAPIEVFYTANSYTDGNLFNRYHKKFIDEVTDKDSKIFRGYFYLTPTDIARLNFKDQFFFERDIFRLLKIENYDPTKNDSTYCEFLKVKTSAPFVASSGTTNGSIELIGNDFAPSYSQRSASYGTQYGMGSMGRGSNVWIDPTARGCYAGGNDISIAANCENVSVFASSGINILPGVLNVNVINSNDITIDERFNGLTVYDGLVLGSKRILRKTASYKGSVTDVGHFVLFNLTANSTYELPEASFIYNGWSVEIKNGYTSGGYTVNTLIVDGTSFFEDGASTSDISLTEESFTYTYRNGIWYIT